MKIPKEIAILLIGNPKFCGSESATSYAIETGCLELLTIVINRPDLEISKALELAKIVNNHELWVALVKRPDFKSYVHNLALSHAISLGKEISKNEVWQVIFDRNELTAADILKISQDICDLELWESILNKDIIKKYLS